jgi:actin-related protein
MRCDPDLHSISVLYENIVLCGGSSLFPGLRERLEGELCALAPSARKVDIGPVEDKRRYAVWVGGSVLSSLSTFQDMWVTKQDYEEHGTSVIHRKCF